MKMLLLLPMLLVCACAEIPSVREPILYNHAVELSVMTSQLEKDCGTPSAPAAAEALLTKANIIAKYTTVVAIDTHDVAVFVRNEYGELEAAYTKPTPPSTVYCKAKANLVGQSVDLLIKMLGNKPHG